MSIHSPKKDAILRCLKKRPSMKNKEVISTLGKKGVRVSGSFISNTRAALVGRDAPSENGRSASATTLIDVVRRVKELADEVGGMDELADLVDAIACD